MKKILALILIIGCILSFAACDMLFPTEEQPTPDNSGVTETPAEDEKEEPAKPDDAESLPAIQDKIDASNPKGAVVTVTFNTALGELVGTYNVDYAEDGSATVNYSYEKFNTFTEGQASTELKSTVTGTATVAVDGTVSGDLGQDGLNAVSFKLQLDASKLSDVAINAGVLKATVKAENTAEVLGVALAYDVQLVVTTGTNGVTSMSLAYTATKGEVEIVALYK